MCVVDVLGKYLVSLKELVCVFINCYAFGPEDGTWYLYVKRIFYCEAKKHHATCYETDPNHQKHQLQNLRSTCCCYCCCSYCHCCRHIFLCHHEGNLAAHTRERTKERRTENERLRTHHLMSLTLRTRRTIQERKFLPSPSSHSFCKLLNKHLGIYIPKNISFNYLSWYFPIPLHIFSFFQLCLSPSPPPASSSPAFKRVVPSLSLSPYVKWNFKA